MERTKLNDFNRIDTLLNNSNTIKLFKELGKTQKLGRFIGVTFGFQPKMNHYLATYSKGVILFELIDHSSNNTSIEVKGISTVYKP